ncbi:MAG TPA: Calx-beta domain-containing protein [Candidatus Thermoplasmatota archaeon]|nr:Calx-beta domain-containing protein [Candidatus Thermoplasmatota archaeon]
MAQGRRYPWLLGVLAIFTLGATPLGEQAHGSLQAQPTPPSAPCPPSHHGFRLQSAYVLANRSDGHARLEIKHGGSPTQKVSLVDYATRDGLARASEDYESTSGTLRFAPNESIHVVRVPLLPGPPTGGNRTFEFELSNARNEDGATRCPQNPPELWPPSSAWVRIVGEEQANRREAAPAASVDPDVLRFGEVRVGRVSAPRSSTLGNGGPSTLSLPEPQLGPEWRLSHECAAVPPGSACLLNFRFSPVAAGERSAHWIYDDGTHYLSIALHGVGVSAVDDGDSPDRGATPGFESILAGLAIAVVAIVAGRSKLH